MDRIRKLGAAIGYVAIVFALVFVPVAVALHVRGQNDRIDTLIELVKTEQNAAAVERAKLIDRYDELLAYDRRLLRWLESQGIAVPSQLVKFIENAPSGATIAQRSSPNPTTRKPAQTTAPKPTTPKPTLPNGKPRPDKGGGRK